MNRQIIMRVTYRDRLQVSATFKFAVKMVYMLRVKEQRENGTENIEPPPLECQAFLSLLAASVSAYSVARYGLNSFFCSSFFSFGVFFSAGGDQCKVPMIFIQIFRVCACFISLGFVRCRGCYDLGTHKYICVVREMLNVAAIMAVAWCLRSSRSRSIYLSLFWRCLFPFFFFTTLDVASDCLVCRSNSSNERPQPINKPWLRHLSKLLFKINDASLLGQMFGRQPSIIRYSSGF